MGTIFSKILKDTFGVHGIPRTAGTDPYFFRTRTQEYGYGRITGTGENSKEGTEYGTNTVVFENAKYGYGTLNEFF